MLKETAVSSRPDHMSGRADADPPSRPRTAPLRVSSLAKHPARRHLPPVMLIAATILAWQILAGVFHVKTYVLPRPTEVINTLVTQRADILTNAEFTIREIAIGFALSVVIGLALAFALNVSRVLRQTVYPILVGSQTVPIVVLAPILVVMFGLGMVPKLAIVTLICFFPIVVNAVDGLASVDPEYVRMMRTLHASRWDIFRRIEFPSALPLIFSGARIAATYAAIGAVFAEYSGSNEGLGYLIQQATPDLDTSLMFAAVLVLTLLALVLFSLVNLTERLTAPWIRASRHDS
jgi:putative hydroxymethylpyrimidine transport system permease protein